MRKLLMIIAVLGLLGGASTAFAGGTADVVFIVDISGSMSGEHAWLSSMISDMDAGLAAKNVTGEYSLVSYGNYNGSAPITVLDSGSAAQFSAAAGGLSLSGGFEDGYLAMQYALDNLTLGQATNFVLVTDEDRDVSSGSTDTYASILAGLARTADGGKDDIILNAVINAQDYDYISGVGYVYSDGMTADSTGAGLIGLAGDGTGYLADGSGGYTTTAGSADSDYFYGTTYADYVEMAWDTDGLAWDLNELRAGGLTADSFSSAFVDIKVDEIVDQIVPLPSSALLGLALLGGLGIARRVRRRRN